MRWAGRPFPVHLNSAAVRLFAEIIPVIPGIICFGPGGLCTDIHDILRMCPYRIQAGRKQGRYMHFPSDEVFSYIFSFAENKEGSFGRD